MRLWELGHRLWFVSNDASGYRELRKRGVSVREAWNTSKSAHGPWRLSKTPALTIALPLRFFNNLGLPNLAPR